MLKYKIQIFEETSGFWLDLKSISDNYDYALILYKQYCIFFPKNHFRIIKILDIR